MKENGYGMYDEGGGCEAAFNAAVRVVNAGDCWIVCSPCESNDEDDEVSACEGTVILDDVDCGGSG